MKSHQIDLADQFYIVLLFVSTVVSSRLAALYSISNLELNE